MKRLLEELFQSHYADIYRYLYSLSRDADLSEELTAQVFLEVVKSIALFREEADIRTWLFSIARHCWYRYLRKKKDNCSLEELPGELMAPGKSLEEGYADREAVRRIFAILDGEPERTRKIVLLRLEGHSFRAIGVRMGISENSARVIDFRAKQKVRRILEEEGFVYE